MKKVIGISGSILYETEENFNGYPRSFVSEDYVKAIQHVDAIPIIIPIVENESFVKHYVSIVDGVVLSGGYDIDPSFYQEKQHPKLGTLLKRRDEFELLLLKEAILQNKPVLGICRGLQLINVFFKGSLYQDLPSQFESKIEHNQLKNPTKATHFIKVVENSFLSICGKSTLAVNSFHHQAIHQLGNDLIVAAKSEDGIIEAIQHKNLSIYAVQFHPEMMYEEFACLFKYFVEKSTSSE